MLPLLYHAHYSRHLEDLPFWLEQAADCGGPVLELGCGTGRVSIPLLQAGYDVFGVDRDWGMLRELRSRIPEERVSRIHLIRADISAFCLALRFPVILAPCNTVSTLPAEKRRALYGCILRHLEPSGLFIASLPNPAQLAALPAVGDAEIEELFTHPQSGYPVQVSSAWQRYPGVVEFRWHYDHLLPDGQVERQTMRARHALLSPGGYEAELRSRGLGIVKLVGDFSGDSYTADSPFLIWYVRPLAETQFEKSAL